MASVELVVGAYFFHPVYHLRCLIGNFQSQTTPDQMHPTQHQEGQGDTSRPWPYWLPSFSPLNKHVLQDSTYVCTGDQRETERVL